MTNLPDKGTAIAVGHLTFGLDGPRMRGVAAQSNRWFDVPLISHVEGDLYQGGCYDRIPLSEGFKHVVSLYPWEQYELPEGADRVEYTMYDSLDQATTQIDQIAEQVVEFVEDGPTLVHCQAGLNRSGLITARALMFMGYTSDEAITLLRDGRSPEVLCNIAFDAHLRSIDQAPITWQYDGFERRALDKFMAEDA